MAHPERLVYAAHACVWLVFGLTRLFVMLTLWLSNPGAAARVEGPLRASEAITAPHSRLLVVLHSLAIGVVYVAVARASRGIPAWFAGQGLAGALLIASGGALMCWTLLHLRSWRLRAKLDVGHRLATSGPFRLMRHPIYMGLDLLALGTAVWIPSLLCWAAFALVALGGDLRARAEERLLERSFGPAYRDYCARTRRFVPGIY
ncbi:MAG TPA: isoprenylcysteine carboxylmethyltransferase family protein [Methylibium sp.]